MARELLFGSTINGYVFAPSALLSARNASDPCGHGLNKISKSNNDAASRTFLQYGLPSYSYITIGSLCRVAGNVLDLSFNILFPKRTTEYPPSSSTSDGEYPPMSTPVANRSTSGNAALATLPSSPSRTVNGCGVVSLNTALLSSPPPTARVVVVVLCRRLPSTRWCRTDVATRVCDSPIFVIVIVVVVSTAPNCVGVGGRALSTPTNTMKTHEASVNA